MPCSPCSKTCIWLCFEGSSVLSLLVENGEYRYSSRSRIFSEPGTVDFGTEMTRNVSGTMQFHTASRSGGTLTDVYYAGCSDDDFEVCLAGIRGLGLKVSRLPECRAFRALPNGERLDDWLGCAETLIRTVLRANKELDLLRSYRRLSRGSKGQTGLLHSLCVPADEQQPEPQDRRHQRLAERSDRDRAVQRGCRKAAAQ